MRVKTSPGCPQEKSGALNWAFGRWLWNPLRHHCPSPGHTFFTAKYLMCEDTVSHSLATRCLLISSTPLLTSRRNTSSPWKLQTENTFSRQQTHRLRKYGWQSCWSCVEKVRSCLCFEDGRFDDSVVYPTLNSSAFTHNYPPATQVWKSTLASFPCRPSTHSFLLAAQVWHMHTSTCKWNRTWA